MLSFFFGQKAHVLSSLQASKQLRMSHKHGCVHRCTIQEQSSEPWWTNVVGKNWSLWQVKDCVLFNLPVNQDLLIVFTLYFLRYDLEIVVVNCGILCNFLQLVLRLLHNEISVCLVLELKALETQQHHFLSHVLMETVRYLTLNFLLLFPNSTCLFCHSPQQWTLSTLVVYFEKLKYPKIWPTLKQLKSHWFLLMSKSFQVTSLQLPFLHYFVKCCVVQHFL